MADRKPFVVLIDNNDSFTFNVFQYLLLAGADVAVKNCESVSVIDPDFDRCAGIVISPGPGAPAEATASLAILDRFHRRVPILGICLGHQAIGEYFGARVVRAERVMHGKVSRVTHTGAGVFRGLPEQFAVARYHSLIVASQNLPDCLEITCRSFIPAGTPEIMGLRHRSEPVEGVQFHPEAIQSEHGLDLLKTFVEACRAHRLPTSGPMTNHFA